MKYTIYKHTYSVYVKLLVNILYMGKIILVLPGRKRCTGFVSLNAAVLLE